VMPGWPLNADLTAFAPSETEDINQRPKLRVRWIPEGTPMASFRQGVNGYTGTKDTRIREISPDTDFSTIQAVFIDYEVTSERQDPEIVLIRFEDVVGNEPGQVPPGATIHAAMLDFASVVGNAMGAGGKFHPMLQPWQDTDTWNTLGGGIKTDGVQATVNPSFVIGNENLTPLAQGGYHTLDVTTDVQAWSYNTRPNYGWAGLPWLFGRDGWAFSTSEATLEQNRPQLHVFYTPGTAPDIITLQTPAIIGGQVQLNFTGTAGRTYSIERTTTLGGAWSTIGTTTASGTGAATFTDATPPANAAFYRVVYP
jgi:hypothetical protein